jgi:hypothetical protein
VSDLVTRLRNWREVHLARLHLLMEEAADQIAILESRLSLRADLEQGLMDGVARLQAEVDQLRGYRDAAESDAAVAITAAERMCQVLSQKNHCPAPDNAAKQDILTDAEREAVTTAMNDYAADNADPECAEIEATLRGLLERL